MLKDVSVSKNEESNLEPEKMLLNISVGLNQWFGKIEERECYSTIAKLNCNDPVSTMPPDE